MNKNTKQILPLAIMFLILTASYSFASASGSGKGNFSQTTSNGKSLPSPVADSAEELDLNVCGLSSVDCSFEADDSAIIVKHGGEKALLSVGSSTLEQVKILKDICKDHGDYCWKDLLAICQVEGCRSEAIGDQGRSYGYFQIQIKLHKITKECARDISCSGQWTLQNLEKNKYPLYRTHAIQRHNGSGKQAQLYALKVKNIADKL